MPQAHRGHAAESADPAQSPEMDSRREQDNKGGSTNTQPANEGTIASKAAGSQRHRNKQSLDYILKSGLAGGLAGCAV